jgi:uncharacterized protein
MLHRLAPLVPYIAVSLGLFVAHSAWAALIGYHLLMAAFLTFSGAWPEQLRKFRSAGSLRWIVLAIVIGVSGGIGLYWLWPVFGIIPSLGKELLPLGLNPVSWPFFILYFSLVNPWLEEIFWRGWLGSESRSPKPADLFFAGFHLLVLATYVPWPSMLFALLVLSGVGWFWRQVTRREQSLLPSSLSHLDADAAILIVIYLHT